MTNNPTASSGPGRFPLLGLLHPREQTRLLLFLLPLSLLVWGVVVTAAGLPIWGATTIALALLLIPGTLKWRADLRRFGVTTTVLGILIAMQGFHSIEHLTQWF